MSPHIERHCVAGAFSLIINHVINPFNARLLVPDTSSGDEGKHHGSRSMIGRRVTLVVSHSAHSPAHSSAGRHLGAVTKPIIDSRVVTVPLSCELETAHFLPFEDQTPTSCGLHSILSESINPPHLKKTRGCARWLK